jgi:uncharacterized protein YfiM (DUF2279 family)
MPNLLHSCRNRFNVFCGITLIQLLLVVPNIALADSWTGQDKLSHFSGSLLISTVVSVATESESLGFWSAVAVGGAKELWDRNHTGHVASIKDFAWDVAGAYVGSKFGGWMVTRTNGSTVVSFSQKF